MEPVSAAAFADTCVGITLVCANVIWGLRRFINDAKLVGHAVNSTCEDVEAFEGVLSLVKGAIEKPDVKESIESSPLVSKHWSILNLTLGDAQITLETLFNTMFKARTEMQDLESGRQQLRLKGSFREIQSYQESIQTFHRTIDVTFQAAILINQTATQSSKQTVISLDKLSGLIRDQGVHIKATIASIESTVDNVGEDSKLQSPGMQRLLNQRDCLISSATVVSSALTTMQQSVEAPSIVYGSDLGDLFPLKPDEATINWIQHHPPSNYSRPRIPPDIGFLDDGDIDVDIATEFHSLGISKHKEGSDSSDKEAEKYFQEFLAIFWENETAFTSSSKTLRMKHEVLHSLWKLFYDQERFNEGKQYLISKLATEDQLILLSERNGDTDQKNRWAQEQIQTYTQVVNDSKSFKEWDAAASYLKGKINVLSQQGQIEYTNVMEDKLELGEILHANGEHTEALGFGRMAYGAFKRQGQAGERNYERSLRLLLSISEATSNSILVDAYTSMLRNSKGAKGKTEKKVSAAKRIPSLATSESGLNEAFLAKSGSSKRPDTSGRDQDHADQSNSLTEPTHDIESSGRDPIGSPKPVTGWWLSGRGASIQRHMTDHNDAKIPIASHESSGTGTSKILPPSHGLPEPRPARQAKNSVSEVIDRLRAGSITERLLAVKNDVMINQQFALTKEEVIFLCSKSRAILLNQPALLRLKAPTKVVGSINGQYDDLIRLFDVGGYPSVQKYLFLGNYVHHGDQSLKTICLLLAYKIQYPDSVFLLRGKHEYTRMSNIRFYDECARRLSRNALKEICDTFNCLPFAAVIGEKIFCVHSGLSPELESMKQIDRILRPTDIPDHGILLDLLWSAPDRDLAGWSEPRYTRRIKFGPDVVSRFLKIHSLHLIVRTEQTLTNGHSYYLNRQLVSLSSNHGGHETNDAAIMSVDESLLCSFQVIPKV